MRRPSSPTAASIPASHSLAPSERLAPERTFRYTGAPMFLPRSVLPLILPSLLAGCIDDSSTVTGIPTITMLSADPALFLGTVRCGASGGIQRYVVSLRDVGPLTEPPTWLPSSLPSPCN